MGYRPTFNRLSCPCLQKSLPLATISGKTLRSPGPLIGKNWGNSISPYWAARTMAQLGGYEYQGGKFGPNTWMQHLPTKASPQIPPHELFQNTCRKCTNYHFFHRGECSDGWGHMGETIQRDTRRAIIEYSKKAPQKENDKIFNFFKGDDWLIYNRCCVFGHSLHAPAGLKTPMIPYNQMVNSMFTW